MDYVKGFEDLGVEAGRGESEGGIHPDILRR